MTSLLQRPDAEVRRDLRQRRPLAVLATLGGAAAAGSTLLVCLGAGVVGWFLTDGGSHGTPRDGLRTGALAWLLAQGSGIVVDGVAVTAAPLGLTLVCGWAVWRFGLRVGDAVCGHGPDAARLADGERDWTVPLSTALFTVGYAGTALVTLRLAATPATGPDAGRLLAWTVAGGLVVGGAAIAVGSGRAAVWAALLPATVRGVAGTCRSVLVGWLAVSLAALLVALVVDADTAVNVLSQLHTSPGDVTMLSLVTLLVMPNATVFAGSYLLGPGFAVGAGTLVSPHLVVLGPLPLFPLLAALPDAGPVPGWTGWVVAVPVLVAAGGAAHAQCRAPTLRWTVSLVHGGAGGVAAGVVFGLLAALAGGAVGPGRMRTVGPPAFDVLAAAVTALGVGGLLGGLVTTWWLRRRASAASNGEDSTGWSRP